MADIVDRTGGLSRNEYRHSSIVYDLCPKWEIDGAQLMVWRTQLNCLVSRSRRSRPEPKMDDPDRATGSASPNTCHPASGLHCSSTDQEQSLSASILTPASARATSNQKAQAPGQAPNDLAKAPDLDGLVSCRRFPIPSQPHASYHRVSNSPHTPPPPRSRHETESAASGRLAKLQCAGRPVILIQHLHNTAATKIGFFFPPAASTAFCMQAAAN